MFAILGSLVVIGCVLGGYLMEHGNIALLFQPAEVVIIGGAALGQMIIGTPPKVLTGVRKGIIAMLKGEEYSKRDFMDLLQLFTDLSVRVRREGLLAIEGDVERPHESAAFQKFPKILHNHEVLSMITDSLRNIISGGIDAMQLDALLDSQIEAAHEEAVAPAHAITTMADAMPALGIVAAVLGVVITMQAISEPPEVLGHHIGAALVGTFLGVLLAYGFIAPTGKNMESRANDYRTYLNVIKSLIIAVAQGTSPQMVREMGRAMIPAEIRPTAAEMENMK